MPYTGHKNMTKKYTKIILLLCYDERYKIMATPINSNKFKDFDLTK